MDSKKDQYAMALHKILKQMKNKNNSDEYNHWLTERYNHYMEEIHRCQ